MLNYLKSQPLEEKQSFKLVGSAQDTFSRPGELIFIVALLLFTMVNASVSKGPVSTSNSRSDAMVLGEAISIEANDPENQLKMYKLSIQNLVVPYLEQRFEYLSSLEQGSFTESERRNWQGIVKQTQKELLKLVVPSRFKDTHLLIVAVLLEEISIIENPIDLDISKFDNANNSWQDILLRNTWLNEREAL